MHWLLCTALFLGGTVLNLALGCPQFQVLIDEFVDFVIEISSIRKLLIE